MKLDESNLLLSGDILNDHQVAQLLGITRRTLRMWRHTRGLPFYKITTKEIRYARQDIYAWLENNRVVIAV